MAALTQSAPGGHAEAQLRAARAELNDQLLAGGDTRPVRARIAALEHQTTAMADAEAAVRDKAEQAEQSAINARAAEIASETNARLFRTLDGLLPPPWPLADKEDVDVFH